MDAVPVRQSSSCGDTVSVIWQTAGYQQFDPWPLTYNETCLCAAVGLQWSTRIGIQNILVQQYLLYSCHLETTNLSRK